MRFAKLALCLLALALAAPQPAAAQVERCSALANQQELSQEEQSGDSCRAIAIRNQCVGPRHLILCRHSPGTSSCETSEVPLEPGRSMLVALCSDQNFLLRHAACSSLEDCEAFARSGPDVPR